MATNADTTVADDDKAVTEDDLRALKYDTPEVETTKVEDETDESEEEDNEEAEDTVDEDGQTDEATTPDEEDESDEEEATPSFVKEFDYIKGDTPEEYAKNLEQAYKNSTAEALRLKNLAEASTTTSTEEETEEEPVVSPTADPTALYMKQKMDEEINQAFAEFTKDYPQANNPSDYNQFVAEVSAFSQTIFNSQGRLAPPAELYQKAAVSLGWEKQSEVNSKDKLKMAIKNNAASTKPTSATGKTTTKSKVPQAMIETNRKMYPGKTDEEIRKELEPYI